ncbi:MAG: twin-arginine translocase TatA/TatE family subunit [Armatimonadota bacterium]|jgi:sec-independent protein translocase protein TatA
MLAFLGSPQDIVVILVLVLLLFGAKKLPEMARSLGQGIREFRKSTREITQDLDEPESKSTSKSA